MYRHKYRVFLIGDTQVFSPMKALSFNSVGEALRTARAMFPHLADSFQAC